ncbi:hypothetical protein ACFS5M_14095 [Lacinutrix iliipiscaria]|uniref:Uncharacterized protein n=1 Tax=Lacinutrix iliipiscaria TaxID=1230532 RepID=A0ABW5WS53_9FLAO
METATHHSIYIPDNNITRFVPKELAHCNKDEYKSVVNLLYLWQTGYYNYEEFRVQAICSILNIEIDQKQKASNKNEDLDFYANLYQISELIDTFFNKTEDGDLAIKQDFVINHTPYVRPVLKKYLGPQARFMNVSFGQYEDGLNLFQMYFRAKDKKYLYMLMATFYLKKNEIYNKHQTEKRITLFKNHVDFGQVYGFFLFFGAFQEYVSSSRVLWENKVIDLSILFESQPDEKEHKSDIPGLGFKSLAFQIAESGVFGTLSDLRKENLWEVLLRLYDIRKRDLDALAEAKAAEIKAKQEN